MVDCILLAAGQGLRMGGPNKLLLPFRGRTVLETTLDELCRAGIGPVVVVTGHRRDLVAPFLEKMAVREVFNPDFKTGMTGSIQTGIRAAPGTGLGWMICLADMPLLTAADYKFMADRFLECLKTDARAILLPRFGTEKGNPVIFSAAWRDDLLAHPEPEGCRGLVRANAAHVSWAEMPDNHILLDLDTRDDLANSG